MSKQSNFINAIAPLCVNEYLKRKKWVLPSVAIAQASLESGWNINAKTLYGIKGKGITSVTKEEINGRLIPTTANFKVYPNIAESVKGYYDLITSSGRYKKAVNNPDYKNTIIAIHNGGYATDSQYSNKIIKIIEQYNLTVYDVPRVYATSSEKDKNIITSVALDVINGKYGNGTERKIKLTQAGYDYRTIQNKVNQILRGGKNR